MNEVKRFLTRGPLLFDGAMTTYKENRPAKAVLGEYIEAGANAITYTPPTNGSLFAESMRRYRSTYAPDQGEP